MTEQPQPEGWPERWPRRWLWWAVAASLACVGLSLWGSLYDGPFPEHRVGTIGEWMSAAGAVIASVVALGIAVRAETLDASRERLRDDRDWRAAADLRVIAARSVIAVDTGFGRHGSPTQYRLTVRVHNYSAHPIRFVRATAIWKVSGVTSPHGPPPFSIATVLGPGEREGITPDIGVSDPPANLRFADAVASIDVAFMDVHGDSWLASTDTRDGTTSLRRRTNRSGFWRLEEEAY